MTSRGRKVLDSDDEKELQRLRVASGSKRGKKDDFQKVIEISSDSDEDREIFRDRGNSQGTAHRTTEPSNKPSLSSKGVIDLTLDSDSNDAVNAAAPVAQPSRQPMSGSFQFEDDDPELWNNDDGAILTLNEPKSTRKPLSTPLTKRPTPRTCEARTIAPSASMDPFLEELRNAADSDEDELPPLPSTATRGKAKTSSDSRTPSTPRPGSKKASVVAEQARREAYAQKLFNELNEKVFGGGLPSDTKLNWNNRLLTTAGRAKWHRSREGVQTVEIELAIKILDEDERIRNTMAHEMCHLACWIIDKSPQENHGRLFKSWGAKVMRKMPHIEVNTRHSYEINYPYEWRCEKCSKIYGRFSKSIKPEECLCGACKEGRLVPLFTTRASSAKTKARARNASAVAQDSPRAAGGIFIGERDDVGSEDEELDRLVKILGRVDIAS